MCPTQCRPHAFFWRCRPLRGFLRLLIHVKQALIVDACGGWERRVEIPSDRGRYGTIDQVSEENFRILRDILSGEYPSSPPNNILPDLKEAVDKQNFEKLQDAYQACLNETIIDTLGATPLLSILETIIAKYPVESACHPIKFQLSPNEDVLDRETGKEPCSETKDSLTDVIEYLQTIGVGALFSLSVGVSNLCFARSYLLGGLQKHQRQHNVSISKWLWVTEQEPLHR